jgi:hypothetical protein
VGSRSNRQRDEGGTPLTDQSLLLGRSEAKPSQVLGGLPASFGFEDNTSAIKPAVE